MKKINIEITNMILAAMPESKKEVFRKACQRNAYLTSWYGLGLVQLDVYKEGWHLKFEGTRANFSVFAKDNDGSFEFIRKPRNLSFLYADHDCNPQGINFAI